MAGYLPHRMGPMARNKPLGTASTIMHRDLRVLVMARLQSPPLVHKERHDQQGAASTMYPNHEVPEMTRLPSPLTAHKARNKP